MIPGVAEYLRQQVGDIPPKESDLKNAVTLYLRGTALRKTRDFDGAMKDYTEAIRLWTGKPAGKAQFYFDRATIWILKKDHNGALKDFTEAIELDPTHTLALHNRGQLHFRAGNWKGAVADYTQALKLDPNDGSALYVRAVILGSCPDDQCRDGKRALEDARRLCELDKWKTPEFLNALAIAYAEVGQFDEAIKWQNKAMSDERYKTKEGPASQTLLRLFEQHKPYRDVRD
jgi:tetratricopeptide (TPR) repeat protein